MDSNIVVFNDVIIKPPYRVENVSGNPDSRQFAYVKKMVERLTREQLAAAAPPAQPSAMPTTTKTPIVMPNQAPLPQRQHSSGNGPIPSNGSHYSSSSAKHSSVANIRAN